MQQSQAWITQSAVKGEVGIQLGMEKSVSKEFALPPGKSFLFFNNFGDNDFVLTVYGLPETAYLIPSGRSGVITFGLSEIRRILLETSCPSMGCQGMAMVASCYS